MSIKKSAFPASQTVPDSATFDYVYNNTNTKITKANLLTALGVTGTIEQEGNPLSTQVLATTGTVSGIRAITDGSGVKATVNAMNGIDIEHNFTQDSIGLPVLRNIGAISPDFISLLAGTGIGLSADGNMLTITATGTALPATKAVTINVEADFPTAVSGVITLEANTVYIISNSVTTASRFVMSDNSVITGYSSFGPTLTYSGSATMFTGVDVNAQFIDLHIDCGSAKVFDFSDTVGGVKTFSVLSVRCDSCTTVGDFASLRTVSFSFFLCLAVVTDGLAFTGTGSILWSLNALSLQSTNSGFVGVDFGTATAGNIRIERCLFNGVAGAVGIKGAASNANLTAAGDGNITENSFIGAITTLSGIDPHDDVQWTATENQGITNTRPDSLSYNTAGTVVTIASIGVPVKVGGTWVDDNSSRFTVDLSGRVTYNGLNGLHVPITLSITCDPVSGGNDDFAVSLFINGALVAPTTTKGRAANADIYSLTVVWQHDFTTNDYVEVFLQNDSDTTNFNVSHAILRIN
ncbi:MAG: hypothetical protein COA78_25295 [Blastopirellula sp.]|nr:MAG: hypothetical protein COA78_25295 [Blastopirellula sp.]